MQNVVVTMDKAQGKALARLLRNQFSALEESEEGRARQEEEFFSVEELELLEPILHFLNQKMFD